MDGSIEEKWRKIWDAQKIFEANPKTGRKKIFVTVPFPYMNGPLHIGHAFTAGRVDVYARFKRMQGFETLFPWSWHWTGQPLVAAAYRLSRSDPAMLKEFVEIDKLPIEEIPKFYDPKYMAKYYTESGRVGLKRLGLSIDWRREFHTTDLEPAFSQFVLWQMNKLREMGYITRGTHPVVWCPRDQSPTGDHDRLEGEGVTWEEFTLILFPFEENQDLKGRKLPAATLRPETIFGVTNLWINPSAKYVEARINIKETWILSEKAVSKLGDQLKRVEVIRSYQGDELIGRKVANPLRPSETLLILPADFVDPENGSGVVYSVPAHAPVDYVALKDLKSNRALQERFRLDSKEIEKIKPISLISIPGMGEFPAVEIVEKLGIKNQDDPLLESATGEIYKKEFHQGVLSKNTGKFESRRVSEAKPLIVEELKKLGLSDFLLDLPKKVVCRCMTECTVKILEDQWFLKYSDPQWKKKAHECIDAASIYPDSARQWFHDVIDWIRDWPCARKVGLGTPLPWSPGWIVETLSDSTIYMAYYTIASTIREYSVGAQDLKESIFDYVFLGKGRPEAAVRGTAIEIKVLEEMRNQFLYWYPVNLRNSAKELIPNHLLFFVLQHVAFFPKDLWPTCISANGMMMNEGVKMSKSKGNVIPLSAGLDTFGADTLRAALVSGAEGMDDVDWREKNVKDLEGKIQSLPDYLSSLLERAISKNREHPELLLESKIQRHVESTIRFLDVMKMKSAFQECFYDFWNDIKYYVSRSDSISKSVVESAIQTWLRLLSPFIPYTCEEINSAMNGKDLVSISAYPVPDPSRINIESELAESRIVSLISDTQNIMKLIKERVSKLHIYIAPKWSYNLLDDAISARQEVKKMNQVLQEFFRSNPAVSRQDVVSMLPKINKTINEIGDEFIAIYSKVKGSFDEDRIYSLSSGYIEREVGLKVTIHNEKDKVDYDPKQKKRFAQPLKPALYLE